MQFKKSAVRYLKKQRAAVLFYSLLICLPNCISEPVDHEYWSDKNVFVCFLKQISAETMLIKFKHSYVSLPWIL